MGIKDHERRDLEIKWKILGTRTSSRYLVKLTEKLKQQLLQLLLNRQNAIRGFDGGFTQMSAGARSQVLSPDVISLGLLLFIS